MMPLDGPLSLAVLEALIVRPLPENKGREAADALHPSGQRASCEQTRLPAEDRQVSGHVAPDPVAAQRHAEAGLMLLHMHSQGSGEQTRETNARCLMHSRPGTLFGLALMHSFYVANLWLSLLQVDLPELHSAPAAVLARGRAAVCHVCAPAVRAAAALLLHRQLH